MDALWKTHVQYSNEYDEVYEWYFSLHNAHNLYCEKALAIVLK